MFFYLAIPTKIPRLALGLLVIPTRLYQRLSLLQDRNNIASKPGYQAQEDVHSSTP